MIGRYLCRFLFPLLFLSTTSSALKSQSIDDLNISKRKFDEFHARGEYEAAAEQARQLEKITKTRFGVHHENYAVSLGLLGLVYVEQGALGEAESLYKRALAIKEKKLGKRHAQVAEQLNHLGMLYAKQGNFVEAESLYNRAILLVEKTPGKERLTTLCSITLV